MAGMMPRESSAARVGGREEDATSEEDATAATAADADALSRPILSPPPLTKTDVEGRVVAVAVPRGVIARWA